MRITVTPVWLLFCAAMYAQPDWMPKPDCKVTPWLDSCPGHENFKVGSSTILNNGGMNTPPQQAPVTRQATVTRESGPAPQTDWRRPISPKPLANDWPRWKFAAPDASLVMGIKLKALAESPAFHDLLPGIDQLKAVTQSVGEVWVSLRTVAGRPEAVMLFVGPALEPVATDLRSKGLTVCFVDEHSVLAGEWNAVNRALQRVLATAPTSAAADRRARELWANNDVSVVVDRSLISTFVSSVPASITRMSMGLGLHDKLTFDLLLHTARPGDASSLANSVLGLPEQSAGEVHKVVPEGLSIHVELDPSQIPEALKKQLGAQFAPLTDLVRVNPANAPVKGVVISGLDDGPRVVPPQQD